MSLSISIDMENATCDYCGKKATVVYFAKSLFGSKWRKFCKDCHRQYLRVLDDSNANRV